MCVRCIGAKMKSELALLSPEGEQGVIKRHAEFGVSVVVSVAAHCQWHTVVAVIARRRITVSISTNEAQAQPRPTSTFKFIR